MKKSEKNLRKILLPIALAVIGYLIVDHFNLKERISNMEGQLTVLSNIESDVVKIKGDINTLMDLPTISVSDIVYDDKGTIINNNNAPFEIIVKGTCSNARENYLYLVVEDNAIQYVQPGLGLNYDGSFESHCYLGEIGNVNSLNKTYKVFAVIADRSYQAHDVLDRGTIIKESQKINLRR